MEKPLVSIVIPVFNTERYVAEAIKSALDQTYAPIEIICVDDGSSDGSREILASFGDAISCIHHEKNKGIAHARNTGIACARGEYLAFMDADDLMDKKRIELQMECFFQDETIDIVFTHMRCFISPELPDEIKNIRECPQGDLPGYLAGTTLVKRSSFARVGEFNPVWRVGEFIDWYARAKEASFVEKIIPDVLLHRRIHETNTGVTERPSQVDYVRIVREALERRKSS